MLINRIGRQKASEKVHFFCSFLNN